MNATWPDGTPKSACNAFTARPPSLFADDKSEKAKATLARKDSHYGKATGAVAHGHTVMPGLSAKAQKRLKAVPFSAPLSPSKSGWSKSPKRTLVERVPSVRAETNTGGVK